MPLSQEEVLVSGDVSEILRELTRSCGKVSKSDSILGGTGTPRTVEFSCSGMEEW